MKSVLLAVTGLSSRVITNTRYGITVIGHDFSVICVEVENPKQCPMIQIQMAKTVEAPGFCFKHSNISVLSLFRISDFDIRIWLGPKACFGMGMGRIRIVY